MKSITVGRKVMRRFYLAAPITAEKPLECLHGDETVRPAAENNIGQVRREVGRDEFHALLLTFILFLLIGCGKGGTVLEAVLDEPNYTAPDTLINLDDGQMFIKVSGKCIFYGKMRNSTFQDEYLPWNLDQRVNPWNPESKRTMCDSSHQRVVDGLHPIPDFGGE